jgi:type VI secretion system secreted protein VgrG
MLSLRIVSGEMELDFRRPPPPVVRTSVLRRLLAESVRRILPSSIAPPQPAGETVEPPTADVPSRTIPPASVNRAAALLDYVVMVGYRPRATRKEAIILMGNLVQDNRSAVLTTPLGKDVLVVTEFSATEGLNELFEYHIEALSGQENIDFDKAIGQGCMVKMDTDDGKKRIFHGIMTEAQWLGQPDKEIYSYRFVLRPWLWLLGHRADCRIFLDKSVRDIIREVFSKAGFTDFDDRTTGSYDQIDYCVQYRETDLAFVCRMMEHWGIYYFFEPSDGKHTLVMADSHSSHKPFSDLSKVEFNPRAGAGQDEKQTLNTWVPERRFRTGKVSFNDYDYTAPNKNLLASKAASEKYTNAKLEVYDYHYKYTDQGKGNDLAQHRLDAEQAMDQRRQGSGDASSLYPGGLVTLDKHPVSSENKEYLVVHASHHFTEQTYRSSGSGLGTTAGYDGTYEFQLGDRPFRPLPLTPKPRIYGIQTAIVVGKKGEDSEEISTDELGRIWVKFHWDRDPQKTCPIRVAQVWAGNSWGAIFTPRLGMEVVVDFLEGDPDRPLVTGCVYNGNNSPPYALPDNKTMDGWKSNSSKGGGGYNEFVFEDKKSSEKIRMHGEKDHEVVIKDTQTVTIGEAFTSQNGSASRNWTLKQGDDNLEVSSGNQKVHIAQQQTINVDNDITITSFTSITLKVGGNQVVIDQSGVHIQGMQIDLKGNATIQQNAPMITIN